MSQRSKGGRPRTGRENPVTVRLSSDTVAALAQEPNKSELIDDLLQGRVSRIRCPHCGKTFTIKTDRP